MAQPITSSAVFGTASMKPESGEQLDALWGQNIADNTGFLFYQSKPVVLPLTRIDLSQDSPTINQSISGTIGGITFFRRTAGGTQLVGNEYNSDPSYDILPGHHNRFVGTFSYQIAQNGGSGGINFYYDGTSVGSVQGTNSNTSGILTFETPIGTGLTRTVPAYWYFAMTANSIPRDNAITVYNFKFSTKRV